MSLIDLVVAFFAAVWTWLLQAVRRALTPKNVLPAPVATRSAGSRILKRDAGLDLARTTATTAVEA
ncbi:hypothetical protein OEIGOIKO_01603 [Streptomyces chrestomyceticus JCM 4735]|uniref:Uncharacterized protein n=1 Tax=Streptomyces chrestomyceticus JCM 4735 TaxID=1306181 RepID=A0A7U9PZ41_9ACTN|nr:hypothetical protein [Streptomyces chrestomyceticus]GCD33879.1 hypothetical protein OEIGOIKO_01603 [Streptomyces chrestomyceticus JCM 4735]